MNDDSDLIARLRQTPECPHDIRTGLVDAAREAALVLEAKNAEIAALNGAANEAIRELSRLFRTGVHRAGPTKVWRQLPRIIALLAVDPRTDCRCDFCLSRANRVDS